MAGAGVAGVGAAGVAAGCGAGVGVAVVAVRAGGVLSSISPGRPMRYPAMPDASMSATITAPSVDLFMKTPAKAPALYAADCANTVESDAMVENVPLLLRAYHA